MASGFKHVQQEASCRGDLSFSALHSSFLCLVCCVFGFLDRLSFMLFVEHPVCCLYVVSLFLWCGSLRLRVPVLGWLCVLPLLPACSVLLLVFFYVFVPDVVCDADFSCMCALPLVSGLVFVFEDISDLCYFYFSDPVCRLCRYEVSGLYFWWVFLELLRVGFGFLLPSSITSLLVQTSWCSDVYRVEGWAACRILASHAEVVVRLSGWFCPLCGFYLQLSPMWLFIICCF